MKYKSHKKIGLFGGTFNPVHLGHLKMAAAARKEYKLDVVYFIPCGIPPHKPKKDLLPAKKRFKLVQKAIKGEKHFKLLDIEIKKKKPCYTIDTMHEILVGVSHDQHLQLYFLIGQDEFEKLHTWKKLDELAKMVIFLVLPRFSKICKGKHIGLPKVKNLKWFKVHTKPINISSTEIRKQQQKLH